MAVQDTSLVAEPGIAYTPSDAVTAALLPPSLRGRG